MLERQGDQLQEVDDARARWWLAHTATTCARAELAATELATREVDDEHEVTAAERARRIAPPRRRKMSNIEIVHNDLDEDARDFPGGGRRAH
ncbi:hypothetical protein HBB16_06370 [Pseudonocardia sp. MCCB 268]|nr:hypothetical protein [Pseudonocardia cytotoxica]